ncbi:MAG TPA: phospholipase D-like domain-containing protein [Candidatus Polarisedimenticolia bacterium]|nr:phospholipase D-like domain-containing protein [Candidatus Polarisedimenticolia bacterium]
MRLIIQPESDILPVVQAVRRARVHVEVAIFRLDEQAILRALTAAAQRGVHVRALIAHTNGGGKRGLRETEQLLLGGGVTVARTAGDLLRYHGKFMVADDTLHVFGFNFTRQDIEKSRSFGIATKDQRTVKEARSLFEADSTRQVYTPSRSNLVVSPETSREMLGKFLRGARRQLAIYDAKIQDPAMMKILKDRAEHGVEVRVLGSMKEPGDVNVRSFKGLRLHVRAIVRDGTRAFVGSQSLRKPEIDRRREVGLLINNPSVTRKILQTFESDWKASGSEEDSDVTEKASKESA